MFVRLFVDENLDRMVPISKQPKEKIQAIIESCSRQFPEFQERARKRIRTYLKSCRRMKKNGMEMVSSPQRRHSGSPAPARGPERPTAGRLAQNPPAALEAGPLTPVLNGEPEAWKGSLVLDPQFLPHPGPGLCPHHPACCPFYLQTRPTPPHLTSAMAENILAAACESETRKAAKRMRLEIYQSSQVPAPPVPGLHPRGATSYPTVGQGTEGTVPRSGGGVTEALQNL